MCFVNVMWKVQPLTQSVTVTPPGTIELSAL
jgi:hypothetical protein